MVGAGCDIALVDSGLARFMPIDYLAAKSNVGPFTWTVSTVGCMHQHCTVEVASSVQRAASTWQCVI